MVKTTIILDDELYKKLVDECIRRYGSTRKLSKLINEKLWKLERLEMEMRISRAKETDKPRVRLGMALTPDELERLIEEGWGEVVKWST